MFDLLFSNYLLWFNIAIPFGIGLYLLLTTKGEYALKEFGIQFALTTVILFSAFSIAFYSSDIYTKSYNNGSVNNFVYEEEWTELVHYTEQECSGSGKNQVCRTVNKTRRDHHPDNYYINSSIGSFSIDREEYRNSVRDFGEKTTGFGHFDQVSFGDGRTFESTPNKIVPVVKTYDSINYVYASKTNIIKSSELKDLERTYKNELYPYPELTNSKYGNPTFNRVFNSNLIPFAAAINEKLSVFASIYGAPKEVNPIIYVTTAPTREFAAAIKGFYKDAHKNDAILVVGIDQNKTVRWSSGIALTKSENFIVDSQHLVGYNLNDLNASLKLEQDFERLVLTTYKRTPMTEYKYLASDFELPLWFELTIIFLNVIGSFFAFRFFLKNRI